jgi:hypothetical protein
MSALESYCAKTPGIRRVRLGRERRAEGGEDSHGCRR